MCKRIGYKYYCKELFVIKSKTRYSCASAIYFNLESDVIKANCEFQYYYNKTDIKPTVLLCNCDIEAESNFLLESLAACEGPDAKTDLEMHFAVNLAFMNYFTDILEKLGKHISLKLDNAGTNPANIT